MSADDVPGKSLMELVAEHNAAADNLEEATAKIVNLFGSSYEADRVREVSPYCDLQSKELRFCETLDTRKRAEARFDEISSIAAKVFTCEKCRGKISEVAVGKCACPDHVAAFVDMFFQMEWKVYVVRSIAEALAVTTDATGEAAQFNNLRNRQAIASLNPGWAAGLQQMALDARKVEQDQARSTNGKHAAAVSVKPKQATRDYAIHLWRQRPPVSRY